MHDRCRADQIEADAHRQVQVREGGGQGQVERRLDGDEHQVAGLRDDQHRVEQVAAVGLGQQHHHRHQVEQQRQRAQQPVHRRQPGKATRRRLHQRTAAAGEHQLHGRLGQHVVELLVQQVVARTRLVVDHPACRALQRQ
ncbi:MAG: hypothetical protein QM722_13845 [Piscinibacter sp.]